MRRCCGGGDNHDRACPEWRRQMEAMFLEFNRGTTRAREAYNASANSTHRQPKGNR